MRKSITHGPKGEVIGELGLPTDLKDSFEVNYDTKVLTLAWEGELYTFDLKKGDVGDFWGSFTDNTDTPWDINFYQEDEDDNPVVGIYELYFADGFYQIGSSVDCVIRHTTKGDPSNYFD